MGRAYTLVTPEEEKLLRAIERITGTKIAEVDAGPPPPTAVVEDTDATEESETKADTMNAVEPPSTRSGRRSRPRRERQRSQPQASKNENRQPSRDSTAADGKDDAGAGWHGHVPAFLLTPVRSED
jgi:ATP-dependent RNA helicase RhlE